MSGLQTGALRNRITIEQSVEVQDTAGEPTATWSPLATIWASIEFLEGNEAFVARQFHAETTHRIRARYLSGVIPKMRVVFGSRTFDILHVNVDERHKGLIEMMVEENN